METKLHPRNQHIGTKGASYDFNLLVQANPELQPLIINGPKGNDTLDFANPESVKQLNKALLLHHYQLQFWDLPDQFLCPAVPGRADYIHYLADLLAEDNGGVIPTGANIKGLDIGTGANLVYPIIGSFEYQWGFVGADIESVSINCAKQLCQFNPRLKKKVKLRLQTNSSDIFNGIISANDRFAFSMCNPPFHSSEQEAQKGTKRKLKNLSGAQDQSKGKALLNFAGQNNELWCPGGEVEFVSTMIEQSAQHKTEVLWFTSLLSKQENLPILKNKLNKVNASQVTVIPMAQGNKISRVLAWSFYNKEQRAAWFE